MEDIEHHSKFHFNKTIIIYLLIKLGPRAQRFNFNRKRRKRAERGIFISADFFKLHFIDYAITVDLTFPPLPLSTQHPHSLRQSPHHCSRPLVRCISSSATAFPILYFTSPRLFCHYLFVLLLPLTSSPVLSYTPLIWQPSAHSPYP